jgi:hypothetical protein
MAPASPFIVSKERARGYIHGKGVKMERMKEKNKKVASGVAVLLLIRWEQFPYSVETY